MDNMSLEELKSNILKKPIPKHIAIIMDGNGRWAESRSLPRSAGHKEGVNRVVDIVEAAVKIGLDYLTIYAFSTENWKRPEKEISFLMDILVKFIEKELDRIHKNGVKIRVLGDIDKLPKKPKEAVLEAVYKTKDNVDMVLNIGLNYGGRDEILRACKLICNDVQLGNMDLEELDKESFKGYLYTENQPDVDLLIRTSGEHRLSNFMLYQLAYSEFVFPKSLWPDFKEKDFYLCILDYQSRNRRFGGI